MSDKTEMLSVPRELLERLCKADADISSMNMTVFDSAIATLESGYAELRALLAAPAEDVRAVGDEAVGQWSDDEGLSWCDGNERSLQSAIESGWMTRTLYRHPQRPVVLPERMQEIVQFLLGVGELDGLAFGEHRAPTEKYWWRKELRACLDEFARLNP